MEIYAGHVGADWSQHAQQTPLELAVGPTLLYRAVLDRLATALCAFAVHPL